MQLSRKADYALRAVKHLASLPGGRRGSINAIAVAEAVPREFLAKILKDLTRGGILTSFQGAAGGYRLAAPPGQISFLDVIEAVDGPVHLNLCTEDGDIACDQAGTCRMRGFWVTQERTLRRALAAHSVGRYRKRRQ